MYKCKNISMRKKNVWKTSDLKHQQQIIMVSQKFV